MNKIIKNIVSRHFLREEYIPRQKRTSISKLDPYLYHPETKEELQQIIIEHIDDKGLTCSLNDIDVSGITDMSHLFDKDHFKYASDFNCDISQWNVANVTNMDCMFYRCYEFNQDLSQWNVSNVTNMNGMFSFCKSFNSDISQWNVSKVENMSFMFSGCEIFDRDLSKWNVSRVTKMVSMFNGCKNFNCDISQWDVSNVTDMGWMFDNCMLRDYSEKQPKLFSLMKT